MNQPSNKTFIVALVITFGLWGCSSSGPNPKAQAEKIKSLEERLAKMETDYQSTLSQREELKQKVTTLEEKLCIHQKVVKERDEFKVVSEQRASERDALQIRCEMFKKGLQELIGQDDAMASMGKHFPPTATAGLPIPGK